MPLVWEAFTDYRRDSIYLSRIEVDILSAMAARIRRARRRQPGVHQTASDGKLPRIASAASWKTSSPPRLHDSMVVTRSA